MSTPKELLEAYEKTTKDFLVSLEKQDTPNKEKHQSIAHGQLQAISDIRLILKDIIVL